MNNTFYTLKEKFYKIKDKGWIKSINKGLGSIGNTFEYELGLRRNDFEIPDFYDVEIKVKQIGSQPFISLFSATFDGKYLFEIKRLVNSHGWPSKTFPDVNVFYSSVSASNFSSIGKYKKMKLFVNYELRRIELNIYNLRGQIIDKNYFWSFHMLKEKLFRKLEKLAFVFANKKVVNGENYFYYSEIHFFRLKSFDTFIKLIADGTIIIYFNNGVYTGQYHTGQPCDHGTTFKIAYYDLNKLFYEIDI